MKNLAGIPEDAATAVVRDELAAAGVSATPFTPSGEVRATVGGVLEVGGYEIRLDRRWVYWAAHVAKMPNQPEDKVPHLPAAIAVALNDAPRIGDGTYYSGRAGRLGDVVRAEGYAGGQPSSELADGVGHWHIDTEEGLMAFVQWCKANLA